MAIEAADFVVVVSGLPRSGTSMLMQMLAAGGLELVRDEKRPADPDNPRGYQEDARVKDLARDNRWLRECRGRAVKVVSPLLPRLLPELPYRVLFMERDLEQVMASQRAMLARAGRPVDPAREPELAARFAAHLQEIGRWLANAPNIETLRLEHGRVIRQPLEQSRRARDFLGLPLDAATMAAAVDPTLYRQRGQAPCRREKPRGPETFC